MIMRHSETARQRFSQNDQDFHININGRATATLGGTYAAPIADEVVAMVIDPISADDPNYIPHLRRDVATFPRNGTVQHMSECHRSYDPMHYVLMFPHGTNGWHVNMSLHLNTVREDDVDDEGEGEGNAQDNGDIAQGQTLRNVVISLLDLVFSHGQLYVALSRVISVDNLKIVLKKSEDQQSRQTANIVYQEVLS